MCVDLLYRLWCDCTLCHAVTILHEFRIHEVHSAEPSLCYMSSFREVRSIPPTHPPNIFFSICTESPPLRMKGEGGGDVSHLIYCIAL